jgi:hypothetical protein
MPRIEINKVAEILKNNEADPKLLRAVVEEMNLLTQAEANEEKPPAIKKQWAILISDPDGRLPSGIDDSFVGWVMQIPEDDSVATTQDRIFKGAYEYNATRKGRLNPAKTVGEALEYIPAKHFKEADLWIKTKTPVLMLRTDNLIPKDESHSNRGRKSL